jgi:hypothetical protein
LEGRELKTEEGRSGKWRVNKGMGEETMEAARVFIVDLMSKKKTYQFKHSVKDDQITRQKLQISILLILEIVLHVTWSSAIIDAE